MEVHLAQERILVLADRFSMDHAEGKASARKLDAFGTMAKLEGFLARPRDDEFELIYRERRLQPFWRVAAHSVSAYEREKDYVIRVAPEVRQVALGGVEHAVTAQEFKISGMETCREETRSAANYDGLTGQLAPQLEGHLKFASSVADRETLDQTAREGTVVVPPLVKASVIVRDMLAMFMTKVEADRMLEEKVALEAIDLYYRPVYAFRYRRQGKEAVIEFDGLTGETRAGGATFETYVGKVLEPKFLLDAGVETANLFFPGANLARILVTKGIETFRTS